MNRQARFFLLMGCLAALTGVACGAFGAHVLKARVHAELLAVWQTGATYHFHHALGLLAVGLFAMTTTTRSRMLDWSGTLMIAGLLLFSGSLYLLSLTGLRALGAITPFGGLAWIIAWGLFAGAIWRSGRARAPDDHAA